MDDYNDYDYDDNSSSEIDSCFDTTDIQGNGIDKKFRTEATKAILTCWISLFRTFSDKSNKK